MPRKTSQAVKKDSATEGRSEAPTPRRSGRAVAKPESISSKEASRSRRSSTAAQTAASVADSKTPKSRGQRESTPPSDGRSRSNREGVESPATRVKSTRRSTGHINYKESDGEEETAAPKFDENFDSAEEFEESESDENSKPKGRNRPVKAAAKSNEAKENPRSSVRRRGRATKKKSDEESEVAEVSDSAENIEIESTPGSKKAAKTPAKAKEPPKPARGRRAKTESDAKPKPVAEEKAKPSRRSARASSSKEETPKKRPSRGVQAKKYTEEEEEEEIEEMDDSKGDENTKSDTVVSAKRKRSSSAEPSKRAKKDASESEADVKTDDVENVQEEKQLNDGSESEKDENVVKIATDEEPMEVDNVESTEVGASEANEKPTPVEELKDAKTESGVNEESMDEKEVAENDSTLKKTLEASSKQENVDSAEHLDENLHSSDSDQESRAEQSISSGLEDSQESKETKANDSLIENETVEETSTPEKKDLPPQSSENSLKVDENSKELKIVSEEETEKSLKESTPKADNALENTKKESTLVTNENSISNEKKCAANETSTTSSPNSMHSKPSEPSLNGPEKKSSVSNSAPIIHTNSNANFESVENPASKANGEHDSMHTNSISPKKDQYFSMPGRKYVLNPKMNEALRQSTKDEIFTCASLNLGTSSSEVCLQKDKLLNELKYLDANIICMQQISKTFYNGALEPSLHALGFKGIFCQPEDSLKGLATFYKTSHFKLNKHCETSLKHLIEKELEASPLELNDRAAVRAHMKRCGSVLFTNITTISGAHAITVANVNVPATDLSLQTLQVSCLGRELFRINGGINRPLLIAGELNIKESEAAYQLLRDGYLSNEMIEELMRRKDIIIPGKENASLINLLWNSFQHPSSNLSSCYETVLEHEVFIPEKKITSPDLLWYSSDCLYTVGILDFTSDKLNEPHISLKADLAFIP